MVAIVVTINLMIALIGFYVAWKVWKLRRTLANVADTLAAVERSTHSSLQGAPSSITRGQLGIYQLRQAYQQSGPQLLRVRRALSLLGLGRSVLGQWAKPGQRPSGRFLPASLLRRNVREPIKQDRF